MKKMILMVPVILLATGCATRWSKPGSTEAEFYSDRAECIGIAGNMWPVNQTPLGSGYTTPINTNCTRYGNYVNCQQTGGQYKPPATIDSNVVARNIEIRNCLQAKGYRSE